jgi:polysaccharide pyruvyl transferase WcaK-like protein
MLALYQGWLGHRNLGDDALFQACLRTMPRIRWRSMPFDEPPPRRVTRTRVRNALTRAAARITPGCRTMLGGGTVINRTEHWLEQYQLLRRATRRAVPVFSPGVADPSFWSHVPGWADTRAGWRDALTGLPEVGVRGPRSMRLLQEAGLRNVLVAGDPALAFHRDRVDVQRTARRTVGVNPGTAKGLLWGSEQRAIALLSTVVADLGRTGFDVRVFPVWQRDDAVCRDVARAGGLTEDSVDPLILDAEAFLDYLGRFDVVVSFKLHAAVFAAAAGVPFVAIEYQPKVSDFTESIGWTDLTFRSDTAEAEDIVRAVRTIADDLALHRERLNARAGELAQSFRGYAARVEELLLSS